MGKQLVQTYLFKSAACFFAFVLLISSETRLHSQNIIITVAGNGQYGYSGDGGLADTGSLAGPKGVCLDKKGNIYIADQGNNVIRKVAAVTNIITTIAGTGAAAYYGDGGLADTAQLNAPAAVFVDDSGNIFIADAMNNVIREILDTSGIIITVAGNGDGGYNGDSIPATSAELQHPNAVFVDKKGNIYIADTDNSRVRRVDTTGMISTVAGDTAQGYSGDGGLADTAALYAPNGVALDTAGNIYIADGNSTIRKVTASTGIITTIAGSNNNPGYSGDGGPAALAQLNQPEGLWLDRNNNLYIADYFNNVVRVINGQSGTISTYAGSSDSSLYYGGDGGPADSAELNGPTGVFVDSAGFLYLADFNNNRIREVGPGLVQWTAINKISAPVAYRIFPNPSTGLFTLETSNAGVGGSLSVYNLIGQQIYQSPVRGLSTQIDLSNASAGVYFLRLQYTGAGLSQKIVIAKN